MGSGWQRTVVVRGLDNCWRFVQEELPLLCLGPTTLAPEKITTDNTFPFRHYIYIYIYIYKYIPISVSIVESLILTRLNSKCTTYYLLNYGADGSGALASTCERDNAKAAHIVTATHDRDECRLGIGLQSHRRNVWVRLIQWEQHIDLHTIGQFQRFPRPKRCQLKRINKIPGITS